MQNPSDTRRRVKVRVVKLEFLSFRREILLEHRVWNESLESSLSFVLVYASLVDKFSRLCKFSRFTSLVDDTTLVDFNFTSLVDRQV